MKPETTANIRALCDNANPRHADGWAWPEKAFMLCERIEFEKPSLVVELGVFGGRSMLPMALQLKENGSGVIFGIDPWMSQPCLEGEMERENKEWWAKVNLEDVMHRFFNQVINLGLSDIAVPIRATSQACARLFPEGSIDLLHIDGNHSELASLRDIDNYFLKVRLGGLICLDDIHWPSNQAAVRKLDSLCSVILDIKSELGQCRLYRK